MEQFVGSLIREGQPTHAKPIHVVNDQAIRSVNEHTHTTEIVHQSTIGYTDLSTDLFKKCLEFGWQRDIVYRI